MPKRSGPVHVATTKRRYKDKVYETHLLRRTFREDGKVKHETLGNISHLPPHVIDLVRRALRGEIPPKASAGGLGDDGENVGSRERSASGGFEILRSLPHGHVAAVLGTARKLGMEGLLASRASRERTLVLAMLVARIIDPGSKLATARGIRSETAASSLGLELNLDEVSEEELYKALDWLGTRQSRIEKKLADKHLVDGTLVLYDVSSSYYTGKNCELAKHGYSRDGKKRFPQIVYGLLCNADGCPIAVEVFAGNTADTGTLAKQVEKLRERFKLERVVMVGDRGMLTSKRIDEELRDKEGMDWITALRADSIKKLSSQGTIQLSFFDERDLVEVTSDDFPGERLVVCRNPLLAEERRRKREELLQSTEQKLSEIVAATSRDKRPLRGKDKIGLKVGRIINKYKVAKHFVLDIDEDGFSYRRDDEKIAAEAALDGLYVIRTSVPEKTLDAESTVRVYKTLSRVERAFRSLKTVDLKVRPIYHWLEKRVRAHVFLCALAYYVEWHMRRNLQPILFEDEDKAAAEESRRSIVAPAERSKSARGKDRTKRTAGGGPAHSFSTLLKDLATLTKNRVRAGDNCDGEFFLLARPTAPQRRAFQLLGLSVAP